ncbi:MAG: tetratricopeptide repeat protein [Deltaproteobacteria bacterium]|nr:tetratricopeptide repeat protein [Deltaproteobacteria bacterium]
MRAVMIALVAGLILSAGIARAQSKDEAREAFKEAVGHFEAGRFEAAVTAFRQAHKLNPSWRIQYNIGQCEAALKRYGPAIEAFEAYLSEGGDDIDPEREDEVVDGVERGETPLDVGVRVAAGVEHEVTLARGDAVVMTRKIKVGGGQSMVIEVTDGDVEGPIPAPAATTDERGDERGAEPDEAGQGAGAQQDDGPSWMLVTGIAATGVGAALIAVGGGFYAKGQKDIEKYEEAAAEGDQDRYNNFKDDVLPMDQAMITTGFVVGGVLLATGVTLLVLEFTGDEESAPATDGPVALQPSPGGVTLTF